MQALKQIRHNNLQPILLLLLVLLLLAGCSAAGSGLKATGETATELQIPPLEAVSSEGALRVIATTSVIGDVVAHVGGEAIELTTLMSAGQDPHSYQPSASDLTTVASADVIFIHGWNLEEGLVRDLANVAGEVPLVPVAAGVEPIVRHAESGAADEHEGGAIDPHTWLDPRQVVQWVRNIETTLSTLDPETEALYAANAQNYIAELEALLAYYDEQVARIPPERRKLVTNHDALAYFARAYDFEVVGTVVPGASTLAEPSASEIVALVQSMEQAGVCTIFAETTANRQVAETVAAELSSCEQVQVLSLYTGSLGDSNSGADSYIGMMRANIDLIVRGLAP